MHINSSPAHIRLERKMTNIIWQKDLTVIVSDSWGQISSLECLFDGTWILNEKQFKKKYTHFLGNSFFETRIFEKACGWIGSISRVKIGFLTGMLYYAKPDRLESIFTLDIQYITFFMSHISFIWYIPFGLQYLIFELIHQYKIKNIQFYDQCLDL